MDSKSNASKRSREHSDKQQKEKNPFGNKHESLDDSIKNNTERTSLLGEKTRKSDGGKADDDKSNSSDIGKLSKIQTYYKREEIADRSLVAAVKTLAQLSREKSV